MTVSTSYVPLTYSGNGVTTNFSVTWPFLTGTLVVTAIDADGVETVKTITTHYTVATGTVTMLSAPASGTQLRIERSTTLTQASTWSENDAFPQATVEAAFDKLTLIAQERAYAAGGISMQLVTSGATDYWNADDHPISNVADPESDQDAATKAYVDGIAFGTTVTPFAGTLLDDASASEVLGTLGFSSNAEDLTAAADYAAMRALLDLEPGTDVQAYDAQLADIAGITFAQGDILYHNGSNLVKLAAGTNGYFLKTQGASANPTWEAIPGGGDALTSNPLSQFAATTSDELRGVISDETGTGSLVFSNSPTLVTPALGTPASGDLQNCSAATTSAKGVSELATQAETELKTSTSLVTTPAGLLHFARGHLVGLTLSNNGTDATNDIDIAAGVAAAEASPYPLMPRTSSLTKRLDAAWAVGSGNGGLDTGSIANTTYHVWLIMRSDTGVVDALFSTSASAPTMPANYDYKRRIGSIIRASGAIRSFLQRDDEFTLKTLAADVNVSNFGTTATNYALTVPSGIEVIAIFYAFCAKASTDFGAMIYWPDLNDETVSYASGTSNLVSPNVNGSHKTDEYRIRTNISQQVRARSSAASCLLAIQTRGWVDTRGRNS